MQVLCPPLRDQNGPRQDAFGRFLKQLLDLHLSWLHVHFQGKNEIFEAISLGNQRRQNRHRSVPRIIALKINDWHLAWNLITFLDLSFRLVIVVFRGSYFIKVIENFFLCYACFREIMYCEVGENRATKPKFLAQSIIYIRLPTSQLLTPQMSPWLRSTPSESANQRFAFLQLTTIELLNKVAFFARQVDHARWKTSTQNLLRNTVARQVEGFWISYFAVLKCL